MRIEQIAIIYPDETRIPEFKAWLNPYSSLSHVVSFTGLPRAIPIISKFPCDLLIVADRFAEAQGAILLKGLRRLCPKSQIILLATNSTPIEELIAIARNDLNVQYFPQPWDKQSLLAHIEAGIGKETPSFATAMTFDENQALRISQALESLQEETTALSIYLVTELGQVLDYKGSELAQIGEISSLLGGSFAALQQLGTTLGEQGVAANLIHRQGKSEDLYALSVGGKAVLVLRFAVGSTAPRIGTVAFYARNTVNKLAEILAEANVKPTQPFGSWDVEAALDTELDQLFAVTETEPNKKTSGRLLTFTGALKKGLVTKSLINRWDSSEKADPDKTSKGVNNE
jgi:hypothetical protein